MDSRELARRIRVHSLMMTHRAKESHIGSCLSCADILAVLYAGVLQKNDRFILSKGHAAAALYACLAETGHFPVRELETFAREGSRLCGHASHHVPGVWLSTGSLGHGLGVGCGMALAGHRTYVLLSDGECQEGSTWEAALFAAHHRLPVTAIVDRNGLQACGRTEDITALDGLESLAEKWVAFGWDAIDVDGHDHGALRTALFGRGPLAVIANTVKGKGVSFMEDELHWHYQVPLEEHLERALAEVG